MWAGQKEPSQVKDDRVFYVNYGLSTPSSSNSVSSRSSSPGQYSERSLHLERSPCSLVPQKRRSCSPPRSTCPESKKIVEPLERIQLGGQTPEHSSFNPLPSHSHRPYDVYHETPSLASRSILPSDGLQSGAVKTRRPHLPRKDNGRIPDDLDEDSELDREEWEQYAKPTVSADGTSRRWICQWESFQSGVLRTCDYKSKKQLVKRHIETTHLHYKPFQCTVCNKAFPQKTSLDTHMHGHTGSTPHECRYGCGMAFKDPARRHRHMVEEHGYIPRQSKKKHKSS
ncbi:hypothetical protein CONPUDRAFT_139557 [Coniophora puteana RWD-64-598 SS2]|uniref:C2H2-type domain-containing protein n=1 Tax=Coniophora puteana (strain RWD-64-598) TaxID=741705 RepID=A0A5M3MBU1_CONPW|nr:uncharacterized protein CONPUDRAFT_139557 [Coniophora puteana RWD-64-598 SS2]EIW76101.1 hypothetical protein CONPUDRAFT_139557 [Coniophora puteana RWD-64-598 SS2]